MSDGILSHQRMTLSEQNMVEYKVARQEGAASGVSAPRIHRSEKRGMTAIYVELGGKKAIAWSLEWPGWCRIRTSEEAAVQALIETEARYRLIAQRAGRDGNLVEGSTESASMLEFLAQGSIKAEPPWLVPLRERNMPRNDWKFVLHLLFEK